MLRRVLRPRNLAILGGSALGLGVAAQNNEYVSHLGLVRFARAGITVSDF